MRINELAQSNYVQESEEIMLTTVGVGRHNNGSQRYSHANLRTFENVILHTKEDLQM